MSRIIRKFANGTIGGATMRSLVWALGQLLACGRFEKDIEIEQRVERLEALAEVQRGTATAGIVVGAFLRLARTLSVS